MSETRRPADAGVCRVAEAEKERLSVELEQVWAELSSVVRAVYHLDNSAAAAADTSDANRLSGLVSRQVPANSTFSATPGNLPEFSCCSWKSGILLDARSWKYWKSPGI